MNIVIGSYRNPADRQAKMDAYKRLLQAQLNLSRMTEMAYKDKSVRGDAPYIPTPLERSPYTSQTEYLSDINAQENAAIQKTREILPFGNDARTFVLDTLRPREITLDPLAQEGSAQQMPRVVLYNQYFTRFTQKRLKGISKLSPSTLLAQFEAFLDSLQEDLLPKQKVIDSIKGLVKRMSSVSSNPGDLMLGKELTDMLDSEPLREEKLAEVYDELKARPSFATIKMLIPKLESPFSRRGSLAPEPESEPEVESKEQPQSTGGFGSRQMVRCLTDGREFMLANLRNHYFKTKGHEGFTGQPTEGKDYEFI